jgi:uncharacterized protein (TIGR02284 family)
LDWRNVISILNGLLESTIVEERICRACAQSAKDASLRAVFGASAARCEEYAGELERKIRYRGGDPVENESVSSFAQRGWTSLKPAGAMMDDRAILLECERGEDIAKRVYEEALKNYLPVDIRIFVAQQYKGMQENSIGSRDFGRRLRNGSD